MMGSRSGVLGHNLQARRPKELLTTSPEGLMLERVRVAEIKPPLTVTGTVHVQTLHVGVAVLGTLASAKTIHGTFLRRWGLLGGVSSKALPPGITGTISVPLWTLGGGVVRCMSCPVT